MNLSGIISIAGKPGLYKVVAQGKNNIIVEGLADGKKSPAYSTDRISALEDISIYTYEEDVPLKEVYKALFEKLNGEAGPSHKENISVLKEALENALPNYDKERVYDSDIKKLFQWYNLCHNAGLLTSTESEENENTKEKTSEDKENSEEA